MPNKNLKEENVKAVLKIIKESNGIVMMKSVAHSIGKDHRYNQAFLDALEGVGLIKLESIATMKMISLTDKGNDFLESN